MLRRLFAFRRPDTEGMAGHDARARTQGHGRWPNHGVGTRTARRPLSLSLLIPPIARTCTMGTQRIWDIFLTARDKEVLAQAGYGKSGGFGTRPALFIIDVQYNFCGDQPEDILEGLKQYRTHCGREAWDAVRHIEPLLHLAREKKLPVFYTETARRADLLDSGVQVGKNFRGGEKTVVEGTHATQTVAPLAPRDQDIRIAKRKPSCFFGTIFMSHLNYLDID